MKPVLGIKGFGWFGNHKTHYVTLNVVVKFYVLRSSKNLKIRFQQFDKHFFDLFWAVSECNLLNNWFQNFRLHILAIAIVWREYIENMAKPNDSENILARENPHISETQPLVASQNSSKYILSFGTL